MSLRIASRSVSAQLRNWRLSVRLNFFQSGGNLPDRSTASQPSRMTRTGISSLISSSMSSTFLGSISRPPRASFAHLQILEPAGRPGLPGSCLEAKHSQAESGSGTMTPSPCPAEGAEGESGKVSRLGSPVIGKDVGAERPLEKSDAVVMR